MQNRWVRHFFFVGAAFLLLSPIRAQPPSVLQRHDEEVVLEYLRNGADVHMEALTCSESLLALAKRHPGIDRTQIEFSPDFIDALILTASRVERSPVFDQLPTGDEEIAARAEIIIARLSHLWPVDRRDRFLKPLSWSDNTRRRVLHFILEEERKTPTKVWEYKISDVHIEQKLMPSAEAEAAMRIIRLIEVSGQPLRLELDLLRAYIHAVSERDRAELAIEVLGIAINDPVQLSLLMSMGADLKILLQSLVQRVASAQFSQSASSALRLLEKLANSGVEIPMSKEDARSFTKLQNAQNLHLEGLEMFVYQFDFALLKSINVLKGLGIDTQLHLRSEAQKIAAKVAVVLQKASIE